MATPRQMTAHTLEAHKGWPSPHALDYAAKLSSNVTIDPVFAGRCVHVNSAGEFEMGCPDDGATKIHMPIFLFQNSDDPDVSNPGGITGSVDDAPGGWLSIAPTGVMNGLVATGGYELATTEFLGAVYNPGDPLKADDSNTSDITGGRLEVGTTYADAIVGTVSRPHDNTNATRNSHGIRELSFWPLCIPPTA